MSGETVELGDLGRIRLVGTNLYRCLEADSLSAIMLERQGIGRRGVIEKLPRLADRPRQLGFESQALTDTDSEAGNDIFRSKKQDVDLEGMFGNLGDQSCNRLGSLRPLSLRRIAAVETDDRDGRRQSDDQEDR